MPMPANIRRRCVEPRSLLFAAAAFSICFLGIVRLPAAAGQNTQLLSRSVTIISEPPGASIWTRDGSAYTCTNTVTPGTLHLTFHGENDVKQLLLTRFGYVTQELNLDATRDGAAANLVAWGAPFFTASGDAPLEIRSLDGKLKKEFEEALIVGGDAFRCSPFEFQFIGVVESDERHELELGVLVDLGTSVAAKNLNLASRSHRNPDERLRQMGQVALDAGASGIIARFRAVAVKFPEVKGVSLACSYSTNKAVINSEHHSYVQQYSTPIYGNSASGTMYQKGTEITTWVGSLPNDVVKDRAVTRTLILTVPLAKIPATGDNKAIADAVLSNAAIRDIGNNTSFPPPAR